MKSVKPVIITLAIIHLIGIIGIGLCIHHPELFSLTWAFLLASIGALLFFHRPFKWFHLPVFFSIVTIGFFAEVLGVKTGLIFGDYAYGGSLGYKLFDVPLLIGINWLMLVYCSRIIAEKIFRDRAFRIFFGALLMVAYDIVLEMPAGRLDMWTWATGSPGWSNYLGWFGVAVLMHCIVECSKFRAENRLARPLFIIQFLFFSFLTALFFVI